jgi:hypothetical protein
VVCSAIDYPFKMTDFLTPRWKMGVRAVVSGKVFAARQAAENCLNLGCPLANQFMKFKRYFPLPPRGERAG